jgi:leader peptidase (prepilin peptidase)/N-methyltransferase
VEQHLPLPIGFWAVFFGIAGAVVGSFLNMAIWRLPRRKPAEGVFWTLNNPRRSYCPNCQKPLSALDNVPLVSFLALRAKCRQCRAPIAWRYFWVEALTAGCFLAILFHFGATAEAVAYCLFFASLLAALFIDIEHFIIPDELNTFALLIGIAFDVWATSRHLPGHSLLWGWLPHSVFGAVVCAGVFVFIQLLGFVLFRKEAMGDGDVKLARAIGAMLPLSQALVSFLLAIAVGAVLGGLMLGIASAQEAAAARKTKEEAERKVGESAGTTSGTEDQAIIVEKPIVVEELEEPSDGDDVSLGEIAVRGMFYLAFVDLVVGLAAALRIPAAVKMMEPLAEEGLSEEEDFHPGPTHIPFGPYMVVGAFLSVFVGDSLIRWYVAWTGLG